MPNVAEARGLLNSADILFTAAEVDAAVDRMATEITAKLGETYPLVLSVMGARSSLLANCCLACYSPSILITSMSAAMVIKPTVVNWCGGLHQKKMSATAWCWY